MTRIPIVNEQDEIIGYREREDRDPKNIMRITALWVTDPNGSILLAQRALSKKNNPGEWGPAVAGSVEEGETYESNIYKEAKEEIGLTNTKLTLGPKVRRSTGHEHFTQWYTVTVPHDYPFTKQDEEVEEIKWFSREELKKLLEEKPEIFLRGFKKWFDDFNPKV